MSWLRDVLEPHVVDGPLPGVVAVVAGGDATEAVVLGSGTRGGPPLARDAQFRIASVSKPFTGAAVLALVEEGLLALDEPVDRLLPELAGARVLRRPDGPLDDTLAAARPVTAHDLLTFTGGIGQDFRMFVAEAPWPVLAAERALDLHTFGPPLVGRMPTPDHWMQRLGSLPLLAQPGERWLYNTSAAVLGVLAGRAAGTSFGEVLRTRVLAPLGLTGSGFQGDRLVTAYQPDGTVFDAADGDWSRPPAFEDGSGGMVSTADDVVAFGRAMLRGTLLTDASRAAMTTAQVTPEQIGTNDVYLDGASWGYSQAVHPDGSFGWDGGFGTSYRVYPEQDLVVVVLTQVLWQSPTDSALHDEVRAAAVANA